MGACAVDVAEGEAESCDLVVEYSVEGDWGGASEACVVDYDDAGAVPGSSG